MKRLIFLAFLLISTAALAEDKWRYEMVAASSSGFPGVYRLDRETGQIAFCYYYVQSANRMEPAGVVCTPPAK